MFTDWLPIEFHEPNTGQLAGVDVPDDLSWASIDDVSVDLGEPAPFSDEQSEPALLDAADDPRPAFRTRVEQFAQTDDLPPAAFDERRESLNIEGRFPDQFPDYGGSSRPAVSSNAAPRQNVSVAASSDLANEVPPSPSRDESRPGSGRFADPSPFRTNPARQEFDSREFPSEIPRNEVASRESILLTAGEESDAEQQPGGNRGAAEPSLSDEPPRIAANARPTPSSSDSLTTTDDTTSKIGAIDTLLENGDYIVAHREMSNLYWRQPELRSLIMSRIEQNAARIYFNPQPHFLQPYELQSGDLLQRVAPKYSLSWQYLAKLNRISDPSRIRAGQKLKVIKGPFSAFVDLSDFELTVHAHGFVVKRYSVGIGQDGSSPVGKFKVLEKIPTPQYTDPDGRVIAGGAPNNPLGPYWLDLGDSYGIHGTLDPNSIGKAESRGCIRMRNEEVAEVYDFLITGSEVVIRP